MKYYITYCKTYHDVFGSIVNSVSETFVHKNLETLKKRYMNISKKYFKEIDEDINFYDNDSRFNDLLKNKFEHYEYGNSVHMIILNQKEN